MIARVTIIITILVFPLSAFSQMDTLWRDSIRSQASSFFTKVDKIELAQLEPYCTTGKRPVGLFGRMKKVQVCYAESVLRCNQDEGKLTCTIDTSHLGSRSILDKGRFDYLFNLLYMQTPSNVLMSCYNPRHGIIFSDSDGLIIGFIEICFECSQIYALPNTPLLGVPRGDAFVKLELLFKESNL
jgi:hypothetical protein